MIKVTKEDFSVDQVLGEIREGSTGGVVSFIGVVRNESRGKMIEKMEIEVYKEMAINQLETIRKEAIEKFGVQDIHVIHRYGSLRVNDNIVLIAVASAHRVEAFEACRYVIDELKKRVPIWKKEFTSEGEYWVEAVGYAK